MKVVIIGGGGHMGQFVTNFLNKNKIQVFQLNRGDEYNEKIKESDVVAISVSEKDFYGVIERLKNINIDEKLIVDFSSQISKHVPQFERLSKNVGFMHFLFGPNLRSVKNQNIIVSGKINNPVFKKIVNLFKNEGAYVTESTPEEHDKMMALTQALSQFSSITLAKTMAENSSNKEMLEKFSTITSSLNMEAISRIASQKPELWATIQFENQFFKSVMYEHKKNIEKAISFVENMDYVGFEKMFEKLQGFWREDREDREQQEIYKSDNEVPLDDSLGILGPAGTYSEEAATFYDKNAQVIYYETIPEAIKALSSDKIKKIFLPFENSIQGTILETLDGIDGNNLKIIEEIVMPIKHCIAGIDKKIPEEKIQEIYSHPQAIAQSSEYLEKHYPNAKHVVFPSTTAGFIKIKQDGTTSVLGVGPSFAARKYGLQIVDENIQNTDTNETLFVAVMKKPTIRSTSQSTLLAIHPNIDKPGLLYDILKAFKIENVNLLKIESRPSKEKLGEYIFYIKAGLSPGDAKLAGIVEKLKNLGKTKILTH